VEPLFGVPRRSRIFRDVVCLDLVHGRVGWNMNAMLAIPLGRFLIRVLAMVDARAGEITARLVAEGVLRPRRLPGGRVRPWLSALRMAAASATGLLAGLRVRRLMARMEASADALRARPPAASLTDAALVEELRLLVKRDTQALHDGLRAMGVALGVF